MAKSFDLALAEMAELTLALVDPNGPEARLLAQRERFNAERALEAHRRALQRLDGKAGKGYVKGSTMRFNGIIRVGGFAGLETLEIELPSGARVQVNRVELV